MTGDDDRRRVLEALLAEDDLVARDPVVSELISGSDMFWIATLALARVVRDDSDESAFDILDAAVMASTRGADSGRISVWVRQIVVKSSLFELASPRERWEILLGQMRQLAAQESVRLYPSRTWPPAEDGGAIVAELIDGALTGRDHSRTYQEHLAHHLETWPWLSAAAEFQRVYRAVRSSNEEVDRELEQPFELIDPSLIIAEADRRKEAKRAEIDEEAESAISLDDADLSEKLAILEERERNDCLVVASAMRNQSFGSRPSIHEDHIEWTFEFDLLDDDTLSLEFLGEATGSARVRRRPSGEFELAEASGVLLKSQQDSDRIALRPPVRSIEEPTKRLSGRSRASVTVAGDRCVIRVHWSR